MISDSRHANNYFVLSAFTARPVFILRIMIAYGFIFILFMGVFQSIYVISVDQKLMGLGEFYFHVVYWDLQMACFKANLKRNDEKHFV